MGYMTVRQWPMMVADDGQYHPTNVTCNTASNAVDNYSIIQLYIYYYTSVEEYTIFYWPHGVRYRQPTTDTHDGNELLMSIDFRCSAQ